MLTVVFAVAALACSGVCHDADDCHAVDETAVYGCLCCNPVTLQSEQAVPVEDVPCGFVACEALVCSTLLTADIFRPPAC
ncbi:MAG: hypothetical protein KKG09_06880 [Verrucomicrobia bacterium]|nr:hypothetical protein [Verrucomicrobiota bacterium]MCG2681364.1 hypothetical protein [Kiritimatiellia bacterium]MBU4247640.1 hypothetical protein [Verrucomicrobiota bacterium]MBU4290821.1 hypothetical protein [Verrucomicrobiota bacterium]MBU4430324.1 hypothetical protein [Verrucomicrobiota bacterium]